MPHKPTGPYKPLWSEQGEQAARNERKRAKQERNRQRIEGSLEQRPEGPPSDFAEDVPNSSHTSMPLRIQKGVPLRLARAVAVGLLAIDAFSGRGLTPGVDAFATDGQITKLRAEYMEAQLAALKVAWCLGTDPQIRKPYVNRMGEIERDYRQFMGRYPKERTCKDLGAPEMPIDAR